jgi:hypothetical protein
MLQPPTILELSLEPSSAPDLPADGEGLEIPEVAAEATFELLRGPWYPMFGDTPHYEPAG